MHVLISCFQITANLLCLASEQRARKRPPLSGQIHGRNIHSTQTLVSRTVSVVKPIILINVRNSLQSSEKCEVVMRRKLCNLRLRPNHVAKFCRSRTVCSRNRYSGRHHHLLHLSVQNDEEPSVSSHHTSLHRSDQAFPRISSRGVALAVVPVIVRNGARTSTLARRLNLRGQHTKLTLKTLTDDKTLRSTEVRFDVDCPGSNESICVQREPP
ncbi:hypothetical protein X801_06922 [Opisthorchis viverrini]|uniref:Secreted protein n=1 Tax=Opisthorchis viverrini TaxID=6198 RepID=A0A1S8WRY3_OPIVI|nr:hypothetical protein X801_06922 [Opisthorchis viverrini]